MIHTRLPQAFDAPVPPTRGGAEAQVCGDEGVSAGRGPGQRGWYAWIAQQVAGATVLDVGCGLGYGLDLLRQSARSAWGQDIDPQLAVPGVSIAPLSDFAAKTFDVVVAVDVIEHVQRDRDFLEQLCRLAKRRVILTTPNWTAGQCEWPYHVREYTPAQLWELCSQFGRCRLWKGTPDGSVVFEVRHRRANRWLNAARRTRGTATVTRVLNRVLPGPSRIHSHLAVEVEVGTSGDHGSSPQG